jgi:hypothetical protein
MHHAFISVCLVATPSFRGHNFASFGLLPKLKIG